MKKVYLIAVVVAVIAGFATYLFASDLSDKATLKDEDKVTVFVPVEDMEANVTITEEMFSEDALQITTKTILAADSSENYVTSKDELIDYVTIDKLYANEPINKNRLQSIDGDDVAFSLKLAKGKVAYSFSAESVKGVDGFISEGDTVDVLIPKTDDDGNVTTEIAYEGLKVLRVSTNSDNVSASESDSKITEYSSLTVEVTKEQSLELYEIENNYDFKLILNPRD